MNPAESLRVRIDPHTRERAMERGASIEQIVDVIQTGVPVAAREGRFAREKFYSYDGFWKGQYYDEKLIKVIYALEDEIAVTVTVVVKYGRWSEPQP